MGSPYFVHKQVNRIHVVKTTIGFERILEVIARSMGKDISAIKADRYSPEWVIYDQLVSAMNEACESRSRTCLFLEARYEWRGWEKFQRVVIFDFSGKQEKVSNNPSTSSSKPDVEWEIVPFSFKVDKPSSK